MLPARAYPSVFRRQENGAVGEVELDFLDWEIRERDVLRVNDVVVAVVTDEAGRPVGIDLQLPDLEFFRGNSLLETLADRDGVQKPIGAAFIGDVFGVVRE